MTASQRKSRRERARWIRLGYAIRTAFASPDAQRKLLQVILEIKRGAA